MIVVWLLLAVPWVCLQFVIVVFPDYFCPICPDIVESEEHFLIDCKKYDSLRKTVKLYQKLYCE